MEQDYQRKHQLRVACLWLKKQLVDSQGHSQMSQIIVIIIVVVVAVAVVVVVIVIM